MNSKPNNTTETIRRQKRLAEELRANLARRKAQARSRRDGEADDREEGIPAARQKDED